MGQLKDRFERWSTQSELEESTELKAQYYNKRTVPDPAAFPEMQDNAGSLDHEPLVQEGFPERPGEDFSRQESDISGKSILRQDSNISGEYFSRDDSNHSEKYV